MNKVTQLFGKLEVDTETEDIEFISFVAEVPDLSETSVGKQMLEKYGHDIGCTILALTKMEAEKEAVYLLDGVMSVPWQIAYPVFATHLKKIVDVMRVQLQAATTFSVIPDPIILVFKRETEDYILTGDEIKTFADMEKIMGGHSWLRVIKVIWTGTHLYNIQTTIDNKQNVC
jgi:hypothetical protein